MKRRVAIRLSWIAVIGLAGMVIAAGGRGFAQEPATGQPAAKKSAKSSGRLPAYYAKVVSKEQRKRSCRFRQTMPPRSSPSSARSTP